jgi:hypothetical protein
MHIPQPSYPPLDPIPTGQGADRTYPPLIERHEEILTLDETSFYTRTSKATLSEWARNGRPVPAVKVGRAWMWRTDSIRQLLGLPTRAQFVATIEEVTE